MSMKRDWIPMEDEHENGDDGVGRLRPDASAYAECLEFEHRADSRVSRATAPAAGYFPARRTGRSWAPCESRHGSGRTERLKGANCRRCPRSCNSARMDLRKFHGAHEYVCD